MDRLHFYQKRFLVIEDMAQMRSSLKSMLDHFGVKSVDTAVCGDDGIDMLKINTYDIVLCDYDLGRGKDGQQVLEECRHGGLLRAQAAFILITAAQTVEKVMGALEYEPDGYIAKPLTMETLGKRLHKILSNKFIYERINQLIDDNAYDQAIEACNNLIDKKPKYALPTYRIKANLLLSQGQHQDALELYQLVLDVRTLEWAQLGLAKCLFHLERYEDSKKILEELTRSNKRHAEALDWLSKIALKLGDSKEAQTHLEAAISRSPKAVLRQMELARISKSNDDLEAAEKANRKSIGLGKHSCYKTPETYLDLSEILQNKITSGSMRDKTYATTEALKTLKNVRQEFDDDGKVYIKAYVIEGETYTNLDKKEAATMAVKKAEDKFLADPAAYSGDLALKIINGYKKNGDDERADSFKNNPVVASRLSGEDAEAIKQVEAEQARVQKIEEIESINNRGVELFEKGKIGDAIEMFETAAEDPLANDSILLNLVQALLVDSKKNKKQKTVLLGKCEQHLSRLEELEIDPARVARYQKLRDMYHTTMQ